MDILVLEVSAMFAKMINFFQKDDFWWESSNLLMTAQSQKCLLKWLIKVDMSNKLLVFEVLNEKTALFNYKLKT